MSRTSGLYVHVPFCATRCGYCDFNAYEGLDHLRAPYVGAVLAEAALWSEAWSDLQVSSVFLGGGTPTRLESADLTALFEGLRQWFHVTSDAEITVEANPESLDAARVAALVEAGVNRVSMGAQSFDAQVLTFLERGHDPESVGRSLQLLREAGIDNVNLDLIYGTPGESAASWRDTLDGALALEPDHISAYALTVEAPTPLGRQVAAGTKPATDPDLQADRYEIACKVLAAAGFEHYEISNWAMPGRACQHNLTYWRRQPYLGLGCGAHSYRDDRRWWNIRPPEQYLDHLAAGRLAVGGEELLDDEAVELESAYLGLRTNDGFAPRSESEEVASLVAEGLLERRDGRLFATDRGMFLSNHLALELVEGADSPALS